MMSTSQFVGLFWSEFMTQTTTKYSNSLQLVDFFFHVPPLEIGRMA